MNTVDNKESASRRDFIKNAAALAGFAATGPLTGFSPFNDLPPPPATHTVGIQVPPVSFLDEGTEKVLDILAERGAVNTIYLGVFSYDKALSGRPPGSHPYPGHGSPDLNQPFHGGHYATPHAEFFRNTVLKPMRAPDIGDMDILAEVLPAAKKRGLKVSAAIIDPFRSDVPGMNEVAEIDLQGKRTNTTCLFHPHVRAFWTGLVTDLSRSYDIDGVLFFNERNGPLLNAIGASHFQRITSSNVTCFCEYHRKAAKDRGIDFERAREGFQKLDKFVQASLKDQRPGDGYYVAFQRLMLGYPEIIAYDQMFDVGKHEVLQEVNAAVKGVNRNLEVGFHIEHTNSFNPFYRATRSYEELAKMADFLKIVVYNNCGGERYANFIRNIGSTIFRDVPKDELYRLMNHLLNYANEADLDDLAAAGLSPDYVFRETQRALSGVMGKCRIMPGIDIGIPTREDISRIASPDDTHAATLAAFKAGAHGVIYSRNYAEMNLANLEAAGRAVREAVR